MASLLLHIARLNFIDGPCTTHWQRLALAIGDALVAPAVDFSSAKQYPKRRRTPVDPDVHVSYEGSLSTAGDPRQITNLTSKHRGNCPSLSMAATCLVDKLACLSRLAHLNSKRKCYEYYQVTKAACWFHRLTRKPLPVMTGSTNEASLKRQRSAPSAVELNTAAFRSSCR
jgi:hypothetical protein